MREGECVRERETITSDYHCMRTCPVLRNFAAMRPLTATLMSAELNTIKGAFPPSSSERRFTVLAQPAISCWIN